MPQHVTASPPPPGSAAPVRAARAFLAAYLPWLYGQERVSAIPGATPALLRALGQHPPRVPPTFHSLHPRPVAVHMTRAAHRTWTALVNVTDGQDTYNLGLTVAQQHGRWLVNHVNSPQ